MAPDEGRPGASGHQGGDEMRGGGIGTMVRPGDPAVCWRCGVPFAWTDLDALRRCAELAREAA